MKSEGTIKIVWENSKDYHTPMENFRGLECRCEAAEAFVHNTVPGSIVKGY